MGRMGYLSFVVLLFYVINAWNVHVGILISKESLNRKAIANPFTAKLYYQLFTFNAAVVHIMCSECGPINYYL